MAVTSGQGNPKWTREETILALELYFETAPSVPGPSDPRVQKLSALLRSLPYHEGKGRNETFRNPDGVGFKIANLRQVATGHGLGNTSKMDKQIWEEFGGDPERTQRAAAQIREGLEVIKLNSESDEDDFVFAEGRVLTIAHRRRERNPRLRAKLLEIRRKAGPLQCEICGIFEPKGPYGTAIFEGHHIIPLSEGGPRETQLQDMSLLCANCHRMIHGAISDTGAWMTIPEARCLLTPPG